MLSMCTMLSLWSDLLALWEGMQLRICMPNFQDVCMFPPSLSIIQKAANIYTKHLS